MASIHHPQSVQVVQRGRAQSFLILARGCMATHRPAAHDKVADRSLRRDAI